jgi:hypothetical protein
MIDQASVNRPRIRRTSDIDAARGDSFNTTLILVVEALADNDAQPLDCSRR